MKGWNTYKKNEHKRGGVIMNEGLKIKVDFYKDSGKWYSGGIVDIGSVRLWHGEETVKQTIIDNQKILADSWIGRFHVVINDLPENKQKADYQEFTNALYFAESFVGMKRNRKQMAN